MAEIRLNGVRIANPPGAASGDLVRVQSVEARVLLGSLFSGHIEVSDIKVDRPVFAFERMATGSGSWWLNPDLGDKFFADAGRVTIDNLRI